ncbi:LPS O-antigen chain length determinant protein WzzB [Pelistega sp. MC2]|uniref:LPS O-antigen chain length determinant protein WzzB n=1 Tax=Pelistega sp. MC2 TaxID=1720297 RepID=UPI0015A3C3B2|nr:Wzz/FepE/Etk N-terminal domain-containing protein [Pelistega sp. MC2]
MQTQQVSRQDDEIDLFELFAVLWKKKLLIIAVTLLSIILAAIYAFTAKEEWTSKAQIVAPKAVQLGSYLEAERRYARFSDMGTDVDVTNALNNSFRLFLLELQSGDNKQKFLKNSVYGQKVLANLDNEIDKELTINQLVEKNLSPKPLNKEVKDILEVTFTADTAGDAQNTLQQYLTHTNSLTQTKIFENLFERTRERIATLQQLAINTKKDTEQNKANYILTLKQALDAAKTANIVDPVGQTPSANLLLDFNNNSALFMLGTKYLQAQLTAWENNPTIYPAAYYRHLQNIEGLKPILTVKPSGVVFDYLQTPSLPLMKDKPRKALILVAGALVGVILGCIAALVLNVIQRRRQLASN